MARCLTRRRGAMSPVSPCRHSPGSAAEESAPRAIAIPSPVLAGRDPAPIFNPCLVGQPKGYAGSFTTRSREPGMTINWSNCTQLLRISACP